MNPTPPDSPGELPVDLRTLQEIVAGTAAETGEAFFAELVRHLARALGTKCAWVTEWFEESQRLRALSFWVEDGYLPDFEYPIADTPCEPVIETRQLAFVPDRIVELYRFDESLEPLGAVSYLGIPLIDSDERILGHLAILDDEPLELTPSIESIFRIFAGRAAAELARLRRDRELRDREQRWSRMIESAPDAIVELDTDLRVTRMNTAGAQLFGREACPADRAPLDSLLTKESCGKLVYLTRALVREPEGQQSLWIPDGIEGIDAAGERFPAEATVSRFELSGHEYFTLILRNIDDRVASESRIRGLLDETAHLRARLDALEGFDEIIGESEALRCALADVERVAGEDATVLITGETGTGKELIARAIHRRSPRAEQPLVSVNCAAIATTLQESELFGHEKGAFTGATERRDGRFQLADGGTIFLDEIGEMPLDLQAKLLRVLQEGEFERVGGTRTERVDVRLIAATHRDLNAMVEEGTFREDLLYRIQVFPIHVPPLRERGDDVVLLAESFSRSRARARGQSFTALSSDDRRRLRAYSWPGNVRELQNVIERAWIIAGDGQGLDLDRALPPTRGGSPSPPASTTVNPLGGEGGEDAILTASELLEFERANLVRALEASGGKISGHGGAAERLGMHPNTLSSRMKTLGVERPRRS